MSLSLYIYIYIYIYNILSLSLYIYIYVYIHIRPPHRHEGCRRRAHATVYVRWPLSAAMFHQANTPLGVSERRGRNTRANFAPEEAVRQPLTPHIYIYIYLCIYIYI